VTWTDPRTWVTDEVVTSALLNTHLRDNLKAISHPYDVNYTDVDVVSTATETTVYSKTITGGDMGANGSLELLVLGDHMMNNSTLDTVTLRVKWGGSTVFTGSGGTNTINANRDGSGVHLWIVNKGSTSSQIMVCGMAVGMVTGGATGSVGRGGVGIGGLPATAAVDTTSSQTLQVTAQWSAASANNSWRKRLAILYLGQN